MEVKLYVGNLSFSTTEDELRTLFSESGTVTDVALIKDRDSGRSKGFAFVTMATQAEAEQAVKTLNGASFGERELKVNPARPREEGAGRGGFSPRGGGYGGGRSQGGFGGGQRDRNSGGGSRRY